MKPTYNFLFIITLILLSNISFSQSVPSYVPTNGLVGWWGFNGNAQDGSGNGNHGTVNGGTTLSSDRFGAINGSYFLDGGDCDFARGIVIPTIINNTSDFSISLWAISLTNKSNQTIFVSTPHNYIGISYNHPFSPGNINSTIGDGVTWVIGEWGTTNFWNPTNMGDWNNITVVKSSNTYYYYQNGALMRTQTFSSGLNTGSFSLNFGTINFHGGGWCYENFSGKLDDIGIWNRALTPQEITNLYNSQLPAQTSLCLPTITTSSPTSVGVDTVVIGGDISNDGGSSIVLRGVCYSTSPNPNMGNLRTEDGSGIGSFNTVLRGLNPSTTYYARSYAKNSNGVVVYGNEVSFTTSVSLPGLRCFGTPTVTDIDGNLYYTVQIGNQCWTQSNLKVSKYRNGDTIPTGLSNSQWSSITSGAYAIYNNDPVNDGLYGKLYNLYAVTDSRGLCPTGWHVPSDGEWTILENHLGGSSVAGGALKSIVTQPTPGGWNSPNGGATNSSGFTALPGGLRYGNGDFGFMTTNGYWWSSSVFSGSSAWHRGLSTNPSNVYRNLNPRTNGFSVRCLKD